MIGEPNGAGKTTWAYRRLGPTLEIREFVNADEIAPGKNPFDPEASALAAGCLMIDRHRSLSTPPPIEPDVRISRIRLSNQLHLAAHGVGRTACHAPTGRTGQRRLTDVSA
jgi:hypothetical protein